MNGLDLLKNQIGPPSIQIAETRDFRQYLFGGGGVDTEDVVCGRLAGFENRNSGIR